MRWGRKGRRRPAGALVLDVPANPSAERKRPSVRALNVVLTGNLVEWQLGQSFRRGFSSLGHDALLFDWYGQLAAWSSRAPDPLSRSLLTALARRRVAAKFVSLVRQRRPDLIVLLKADDLPAGAIRRFREAAPGCKVVAFHPDDPFNVRRLRGPSHPRSLSQMREVDHYFTWSERMIDRIRAQGVTSVSYLGFGCDPEVSRPLAPDEADRARFGADVSFVGNWDPKREEWLAPIARADGVSLAIWGTPYWRDRARDERLRACWRGDVAVADGFIRAVRSSRVSMNVLRTVNETGENMRTYEVPACGGVMLAEWSAQQARVFRPDREAFYARTPEEALAKVRALLAMPPAELAKVSEAAVARALTQTYAHRAQTIVDTSLVTR